LEVSTNTKVKLLQTAVFPAVLYGCKGKEIKERLKIPWTVRRINASVTKQIRPQNSLETLVTISKIEIFLTYNAQLRVHGKRYDVRTDSPQWKIRKTMYKTISINKRNHDDEIVQHLTLQNRVQWRDLIYQAVKNRKYQNKYGVARSSSSC